LGANEAPPGPDYETFESILGVEFGDPGLLETALTHRSYAFEHGLTNNERLEFLGDAVLGFVVTDMIFAWYPELPEGDMAKLRSGAVNMAALADAARECRLGESLFLGRGEETSGGRGKSSILADAFEAVLGAIYLDSGVEAVARVIETLLAGRIREQVELGIVRDFKTSLQEVVAARSAGPPQYQITASGPDHARRFEAEVYISGERLGDGEGKSKKEAEQAAAKQALSRLASA